MYLIFEKRNHKICGTTNNYRYIGKLENKNYSTDKIEIEINEKEMRIRLDSTHENKKIYSESMKIFRKARKKI